MKDGFSKKKILVVSVFVCTILTSALVIIFIIMNNNKAIEEHKKEEETVLIPEDKKNEIENKISEYQKKIDGVEKEDAKSIYMERVFYLTECGYNEEYKDKILGDLIEIDNIEKSITSAGNVINYANYFKMTNIAEQYTKILEERKEAEGYERVLEDVG